MILRFIVALAALAAAAIAAMPADGSDLSSFEDAKAEVVRLRAELAKVVADRDAAPASATGHWEPVDTAHSPPLRSTAAICSLNNGGGILLFGGADGEHSGSFMNDTWLLTNGDWQEIKSAVSPGARSNPQMVPYKSGAVMFGGFVPDASQYGIKTADDTWLFDLPSSTWRQLTALATHPSARAYHTFTPYFSGGLLFGGRTAIWTNRETALGDTWIFADDKWTEVESAKVPTQLLQSTSMPAPSKRMGHVVACGLNATVEDAVALNPALSPAANERFVGPADCMLFGGAVVADADFFSDTWLLYHNNGKPVWKQQNNYPTPRGRWCGAAGVCPNPKDGVVVVGGSIDYRVSGVGTYVWTPVPISHEESSQNVGHPPGHTGKYELADSTAGLSPSLRAVGAMVTTDAKLGVVLWGGYLNASGGNHPGVLNNRTWRWTGC